tara:strand:- start:895 stop:1353 length:459 start_codon:yes stop_codon:yes gene_type:complete
MSEQVSPIFFSGISMVTAVPVVALGTERVESGEKYRYIYNGGATTASVGLGLNRIAGATTANSAAVCSVSGDQCLGFVKHVAIPSAEYGWALTRGLVTVAVASSASSQSAGIKGLGLNGLVATYITGAFYIQGELMTAIVSGNSGSIYVNMA